MEKLKEKLGDRIEFIGVDVWINEKMEKVESYVKERKLTYTIAVDTESHMIRSFGVLATPTHIIIDRSGMVRYIAASIPGDIEKHMDELLR